MAIIYNPFDVFIVQRDSISSSFKEVILPARTSSLVMFDSASNLVSIQGVNNAFPISSSWATNVVNGSNFSGTSSLFGTASVSNTSSYSFNSNDFTIIQYGDPQFANYDLIGDSFPTITYSNPATANLSASISWMIANAKVLNLKMVVFTGDMVNNAANTTEWELIATQSARLHAAGISAIPTVGNHDFNTDETLTSWNKYFGSFVTSDPAYVESFSGTPLQAGHVYLQNNSGIKLAFIHLSWTGIVDPVFQKWGNQMAQKYSDYYVIWCYHNILNGLNQLMSPTDFGYTDNIGGGFGDQVWHNIISQNANSIQEFCGHLYGMNDGGNQSPWGRNAMIGANNNVVNVMRFDTQYADVYGLQYVRLYHWKPTQGIILASTYDTYKNQDVVWNGSKFTIPIRETLPSSFLVNTVNENIYPTTNPVSNFTQSVAEIDINRNMTVQSINWICNSPTTASIYLTTDLTGSNVLMAFSLSQSFLPGQVTFPYTSSVNWISGDINNSSSNAILAISSSNNWYANTKKYLAISLTGGTNSSSWAQSSTTYNGTYYNATKGTFNGQFFNVVPYFGFTFSDGIKDIVSPFISKSFVQTENVTSSYSLNSLTASFALSGGSGGGGGGSGLITGSIIPVTSSWSTTSSFALNGGGAGSNLITGSFVPITSSVSTTSSFSITSSNSIISIFSTFSSPNTSINKGLQLYWPLIEGGTFGNVPDYSGNGLVGIWTVGTGTVTSSWSGSGKFGGISPSINTPFFIGLTNTNSFSGIPEISIACWFNSTIGSLAGTFLMSKHQTGATGSFFLEFLNNNSLQFTLINNLSQRVNLVSSNTSRSLNDGNWHFAAATYSQTSSLMSVYIDGLFMGSISQTGNVNVLTSIPFQLAGFSNGGGYSGSIQDVRVWNRALEYKEIRNIWDNSFSDKQFYSDVSGNLIANSLTSSLFGTSSFSNTSSFATAGTFASNLSTGSLVPITSSYSTTSSFSLSGPFGSNLITNSIVPITSSWSTTSSFSLNGGSGGSSLITGSLVPITSSWAITASFALNGAGGSNLITGSLIPITSSYNITSSYSLTGPFGSNLITNSIVPITSSYSTTASFALSGGSAASSGLITGSLVPITSSWSITSSFALSGGSAAASGLITGSIIPVTSSWSTTSSFALNGGGAGSNLITGSFVPITSSYSVTSSFSLSGGNNLITGSIVPITSSWATTASFALAGTFASNLSTGSLVPITSSQAITSSFATAGTFASNLSTGSLVPITSSYVVNSPIKTGSLLPITSSWSLTSSFALAGNFASNLLTASLVPITSSWSINSVSSSYINASVGTILNFTGSSVELSNSSSTSIEVLSNTNNYSEINIQNISSTNTSSADLVATNDTGNSASGYIDVGINSSKYTSSVVNIIGQANDSYVYSLSSGNMYIGNASTGSFYIFSGGSVNTASGITLNSSNVFGATGSLFGTSSYSTTASFALSGGSGGGGGSSLVTGSLVPITSSQAITASYFSSISGSNNIYIQANDGNTYPITATNDGGTIVLTVGQTPVSASNNFINIGTINAPSCSWASSSYSSSVATTASYVANAPSLGTFGSELFSGMGPTPQYLTPANFMWNYSDFDDISSTGTVPPSWYATNTGSAGTVILKGIGGIIIIRAPTTTTSNGLYCCLTRGTLIGGANTAGSLLFGQGQFYSEFRTMLSLTSSTPAYYTRWGICDIFTGSVMANVAPLPVDPNNGVWIDWNNSSGSFSTNTFIGNVKTSGSAKISASLGVLPISGTFYRLGIGVSSDGNTSSFYVNSNIQAVITASTPKATGSEMVPGASIICVSGSSGNMSCFIDYYWSFLQFSNSR